MNFRVSLQDIDDHQDPRAGAVHHAGARTSAKSCQPAVSWILMSALNGKRMRTLRRMAVYAEIKHEFDVTLALCSGTQTLNYTVRLLIGVACEAL